MHNFLVGTGLVPFSVTARSPRQAIEIVKEQIRQRKNQVNHPKIGMSLVTALEEMRLNFVVLDRERTMILAGEFDGEFQQPPTRQQAGSLLHFVTPELLSALPSNH